MPKMISDPDDASAGRKFKKGERGLPEQLGSAIRVDGKPLPPDRTSRVINGGMPPLGAGDRMMKMIRDAESMRDRPQMPRVNEMGDVYKKGGKVGSASKRADGIAQRGKTRGTMVMCGGGMAKAKK